MRSGRLGWSERPLPHRIVIAVCTVCLPLFVLGFVLGLFAEPLSVAKLGVTLITVTSCCVMASVFVAFFVERREKRKQRG